MDQILFLVRSHLQVVAVVAHGPILLKLAGQVEAEGVHHQLQQKEMEIPHRQPQVKVMMAVLEEVLLQIGLLAAAVAVPAEQVKILEPAVLAAMAG